MTKAEKTKQRKSKNEETRKRKKLKKAKLKKRRASMPKLNSSKSSKLSWVDSMEFDYNDKIDSNYLNSQELNGPDGDCSSNLDCEVRNSDDGFTAEASYLDDDSVGADLAEYGEMSEDDVNFDDNDSLMDPEKYGTLTESDETDSQEEIFFKPKRNRNSNVQPQLQENQPKWKGSLFVGLIGDCAHNIKDTDFEDWCLLHFEVPQEQIIMSKELGTDSWTVAQLNSFNFDVKLHKYAFIMFDNKTDASTAFQKNVESFNDQHVIVVKKSLKPVSLYRNKMIFIKNLSPTITAHELEELFADCGTVKGVDITNPTKSVIFKNKHSVETAIDKYNGSSVDGQKLSVNRFIPYKKKSLRSLNAKSNQTVRRKAKETKKNQKVTKGKTKKKDQKMIKKTKVKNSGQNVIIQPKLKNNQQTDKKVKRKENKETKTNDIKKRNKHTSK